MTQNVVLVRLRIGAVEDVPFEQVPRRERLRDLGDLTQTYQPAGLHDEDLKHRLVKTGAAVAGPNTIYMVPGLDIRAVVRNDGVWATQFRVAIVAEEDRDP